MAGTYEQSTTISASPEEVFAHVSDVSHLPEFLPPITQASERPLSEGHRFENDGWFDADAAALTLAWGAQTERTYSGRLTVTPDGDGSRVSVVLDFGEQGQDDRIQAQSGDRDPLGEAFDATLQSLKNQVEGTGGEVVPPPPPGPVPPDPSS